MQHTKTVKRYAKALLEYAISENQAPKVEQELSDLAQTIAQNSDLRAVLLSPIIKSIVKKRILNALLGQASHCTTRLLDLLAQNKRLALLQYIANEYLNQYDAYQNKLTAIVTTASPLSEKNKTEILNYLQKTMNNQKISIQNKINPNIIGGFILRIGDIQYNASVSNKLNILRREFEDNLYK